MGDAVQGGVVGHQQAAVVQEHQVGRSEGEAVQGFPKPSRIHGGFLRRDHRLSHHAVRDGIPHLDGPQPGPALSAVP